MGEADVYDIDCLIAENVVDTRGEPGSGMPVGEGSSSCFVEVADQVHALAVGQGCIARQVLGPDPGADDTNRMSHGV